MGNSPFVGMVSDSALRITVTTASANMSFTGLADH